jgi:hypothetical protein
MQTLQSRRRALGFAFCLGLLGGCAGSDTAPISETVSEPAVVEVTPVTSSPVTRNAQDADAALRRATRLANRVERSRPESRAATPSPVSTRRRTPPPGGMDAFSEFQGKRIGLIHTANVIGEVDPCG